MRAFPAPLLILLSLLSTSLALGQDLLRGADPDGHPLLRYASPEIDQLEDAAPAPGGDLFIVGATASAWAGGPDCSAKDLICRAGFVARVSPTGQIRWRHRLTGTSRSNGATHVAWDAARRQVVVVAHERMERRDFQVDLLVAAFDADGRPRWQRRFDRRDSRSDRMGAKGLALGPDGAVVIVGETGGDLAGAKHRGVAYNGAHNGWDVFVLKLAADGRTVFSRMFGVPDPDPDRVPTQYNDYAQAVAVAADGGIWVVGQTDGDLLRGRKLKAWRSFTLRLDPAGRRPRATYAPNTEPLPVALSFGPQGQLYRLGLVTGGDVRPVEAPLGQADLVLERLSPAGRRQWAVRFGTDRREAAGGLAVAADGSVWVAAVHGLHDRPDAAAYRFSAEGRMLGRRPLDSPGSVEPTAVVPQGSTVWVAGIGGEALGGLPRVDRRHGYVPADGFLWGLPAGLTGAVPNAPVPASPWAAGAVNPLRN
ncbi:MAG: hypothetical protein H6702_17300 [Myxococcales bacterium]|nr:hypothetical protein [Myxococcales bacterium]